MKWYLNVLRHYADFSGRARRKEYWMFMLFNFIFVLVAACIDAVIAQVPHFNRGDLPPSFVCYGMYAVALFLPALAVTVRRLHDTGHSGWWIFASLVPVLNIWPFVLTFLEGQQDDNRYGSDPKIIRSPYSEPARLRSAAITLVIAATIAIFNLVWVIYRMSNDSSFSVIFSNISAEYAVRLFSNLLLLAIGILLLPRVSDGSIPVDRVRRRAVFPMIAFAAIEFFFSAWRLMELQELLLQRSEVLIVINIAKWLLYMPVILFFALSLLSSGGQWRRVACTVLAVASCIMIAFKIYFNYSNTHRDVLLWLLSAQTFFYVAWLLLSGVFRTKKGGSSQSRSSSQSSGNATGGRCRFYSGGNCIAGGQVNQCSANPYSYGGCFVYKYNSTGDYRVLYQ